MSFCSYILSVQGYFLESSLQCDCFKKPQTTYCNSWHEYFSILSHCKVLTTMRSLSFSMIKYTQRNGLHSLFIAVQEPFIELLFFIFLFWHLLRR